MWSAVLPFLVAASTAASRFSSSVTISTCPSFDARWSAFKPFYTTHREAKIILGQNLPPPSLSPLLSIRWIGRKEGESEYIETPLIERIDKQNTEKKKKTYSVAGVDIRVVLQVLEHLVQVTVACGSEEAGLCIRLPEHVNYIGVEKREMMKDLL